LFAITVPSCHAIVTEVSDGYYRAYSDEGAFGMLPIVTLSATLSGEVPAAFKAYI
jgi:hypothetical protein